MYPALIDNDAVVVSTYTNGHATKNGINGNGVAKSLTPSTNSSAVLHRTLLKDPIMVIGATGNYLYTNRGQKILDATGGAAVTCLGHGDERVKRAMFKQMDEVAYACSMYFGSTSGEALAQELIAGTNGAMAKAFIVSSGSEAMEAAMKMARQYFLELSPSQPHRTRFIARKQSYHGTTLGALSMSGHVARRALYEPMLLPNISRVSECNAYRGMRDDEDEKMYVARLAKELDDEFERVGPDTVCAFVAEPVVGAALGCVPSVPGYFAAMESVCKKHGALLIFDEIMCGMGRSGTLHAWQHPDVGVVPDIQVIGKGLGSGYQPIAGLLLNHQVIETLRKGTGAFSHGQTYQGHPVACSAAAEVQKIVREENLVDNVAKMGKLLERGLKKRLGQHPNVGNIRGRGLFWGIEFVRDRPTKEPFDPSQGVAMGVHDLGLNEDFGISLYPGSGSKDGVRGDHILISPAFNIDQDTVDIIVSRTERVIETYFQGLENAERML